MTDQLSNIDSFRRYQNTACRHAAYPGHEALAGGGLIYLCLKLCGESGEVAEKVGKHLRHGVIKTSTEGDIYRGGQPSGLSPEERAQIVDELGDVLWYVSEISRQLGYSLDDVAERNLRKIESRQQRGKLFGEGDNR